MGEKEKKQTEIISIRLDEDTKQKLAKIAEIEYRPLALHIRKILEEYIKDYEIKENSNYR